MKSLLSLAMVAFLFALTSCAHKDISRSFPKVGMSKSEVVETYGSPDRSWRTNGLDHWLYASQTEGKKILMFEAGILKSVRSPQSKAEAEDLEAELLMLKGQGKGSFQDLGD